MSNRQHMVHNQFLSLSGFCFFFRAISKPNKRQEDRLTITAPQCAIMQV